MKFEFDPKKSVSNQSKHGIDFVHTQKLWDCPVLRLPSKKKDELRELAFGRIGSAYWTAIVTQRGDSIRLISCWRSRNEEKELYEKRIHKL